MTVEEVSGRTVDDAVDRALARLGVSRDNVDVEVIREGSKGFFGIGGEDAIVRVTTRGDAVTAGGGPGRRGGGGGGGGADGDGEGRSRRRRRRRGRGGRGGGGRQDGEPRGGEARDGEAGTREDQLREGRERAREEEDGDGAAREERRAPRGERRNRQRGRGRNGGRGRDMGGRNDRREPRGPAVEVPTTVPGAPEEPPMQPSGDAEDEVDFAGRTLRDLLTLLGLEDTEIEAREPETPGDGEGRVTQIFDINGATEDASDELGLLIGRRGETLGSLQYLLNVMVGRHYDDHDMVFGVDVEGYRRRREDSLVQMAQRVADEVRETGDVITLEPMPAAERRIIHLALSEEPGVVTESVGRGSDRQVEVMPGEPGADDYLSDGDYAEDGEDTEGGDDAAYADDGGGDAGYAEDGGEDEDIEEDAAGEQ
ncbi:MAG: Jag N-terminal domain-containing protein [Chloroflexi bacterium]|nr:Jag N-terminal domain-containing protein [Chloroflexota bacterium]